MKRMTKIRLINWHYFVNETIEINGSFLLSGENKAGKSTIIDAVQYVLTTDPRKFNKAANEKSKRDLKGYVRCKTGAEGHNYKYKPSDNIISYVAVEFYDDKTNKYFVIGVKIDSPDESTTPSVKWFVVEGCIKDISFLTGNRPSTDNELKIKDKKINFIHQQREAKSQIMRRLGNLNERFFSLLPLSVAFKPMEDVKEFIYKFILEEHNIDIEPLQNSIRSLDELSQLMKDVRNRISQLDGILRVSENIESNDMDAAVNEILLLLAETELNKDSIAVLERELQTNRNKITEADEKYAEYDEQYQSKNSELSDLRATQKTGECALLIRECENALSICEEKLNSAKKRLDKLTTAVKQVRKVRAELARLDVSETEELNADAILESGNELSFRKDIADRIRKKSEELLEQYRRIRFSTDDEFQKLSSQIAALENEVRQLKNNKIVYPENTIGLKAAIEEEFARSSINSRVYIFCDLLEINDPVWQNAVEGYLNTQRFYVIVEPKYYDIAAQVYDCVKKKISGVGLVNTAKISDSSELTEESLALKVTSQNIYAEQYVKYLLGKVHCCNNAHELKNYPVAITPECMLYQNHSLRKIPEKVYSIPYIGAFAVKRQLEIKSEELKNTRLLRDELKQRLDNTEKIINSLSSLPLYSINENINANSDFKTAEKAYSEAQIRLDEARNDPTYIELSIKIDAVEKELNSIDEKRADVLRKSEQLKSHSEYMKNQVSELETKVSAFSADFTEYENKNMTAVNMARQKFDFNRKEKSPEIIFRNFLPKRKEFDNKRNQYEQELIKLQMQYDGGSLGTGSEMMARYIDEKDKLVRSELTKYESQLRETRTNCELIFRQSFLAQLGEQIAKAKTAFANLNRALNGISYGEDSYYFEVNKNRQKSAFYDMIMSENNIRHDGDTFFSNAFEAEYEEQISELFAKITLDDDADKKVVNEYTDYRSYLDFDIRITNKSGEVKYFSKIYGDMSGGEAQTPYYVAIAASFARLYNADTVRLIMLDEAFDKMDDERIESMMKFFNSMGFQIILGTPPGKIEIIGEYVDEVLMAYRAGDHSIVEEYIL